LLKKIAPGAITPLSYDNIFNLHMHDAGWFFEILELKEEQLFTPQHEKGAFSEIALPSYENSDVINLAEELHITPQVIGNRLPLLALPSDLQDVLNRTFLGELGKNNH